MDHDFFDVPDDLWERIEPLLPAERPVVERTNSWHNRYRGLLVRWERKASNYLAMLQLACGLIAYSRLDGFRTCS